MQVLEKKQLSHFTVRTSDRRTFRRCLKKWGYQSSMKMNLQRKGTEQNIHFWFGSAIHFAMEDYFGYNKFGDLQRAFQAYYAAFPAVDRPPGADEHYFLGLGMLDYFNQWYPKHNVDYGFETVWLNEDKQEVEPGTPGAHPLVEERFMLDLGTKVWVREDTEEMISLHKVGELYNDEHGHFYYESPGEDLDILQIFHDSPKVYVIEVPIYYHGTMDRIVKDTQGRWWIMDWKTAKSADTNKLETDDQISAYLWAAEQWFGRPIEGFVYVQITKDVPKPPKRLTTGLLSVDKKQKITYAMFRDALIKDYGEIRKAPAKMIDFLNALAAEETPEGDRFCRWDLVKRNKYEKEATYRHIMAEVRLMTDPELELFPNFTRDCIWDCPFREVCLMEDRGQHEEAKAWLEQNYEKRPRHEDGNLDEWRKNIPWPDSPQGQAIGSLVEQIELTAGQSLNIILPDKYKEVID